MDEHLLVIYPIHLACILLDQSYIPYGVKSYLGSANGSTFGLIGNPILSSNVDTSFFLPMSYGHGAFCKHTRKHCSSSSVNVNVLVI